jgi:hypothetical protein
VNIDAPKPTDTNWIGVSHVFYQPSGAQNVTAGKSIVTKSMMNALDGKT